MCYIRNKYHYYIIATVKIYKICKKNNLNKEPESIINYIYLGDSGYPSRPYLLTPIHHPADKLKENCNRAHKKVRRLIENAIGELKISFHCLTKHGTSTKSSLYQSGLIAVYSFAQNSKKNVFLFLVYLFLSPERACRCIGACECIHNFCKRHNLVAPNDLDNFDNENFNQQHQPHRYNNYNNEQLTAAQTPNDLIDGSELKSELFFSQQLFYLSIVFLVAHACIQLIFQHESDKSSRQVHRSNRKSSCYCAQVSTFCIKQASHC